MSSNHNSLQKLPLVVRILITIAIVCLTAFRIQRLAAKYREQSLNPPKEQSFPIQSPREQIERSQRKPLSPEEAAKEQAKEKSDQKAREALEDKDTAIKGALRNRGYLEPSAGLAPNSKPPLVAEYFMSDGVLSLKFAEWFNKSDKAQLGRQLLEIHQMWAAINSPKSKCDSKLACWIPSQDHGTYVPVKVECTGVSDKDLTRLSKDLHGPLAAETKSEYDTAFDLEFTYKQLAPVLGRIQ